jgi:hypothetical protein
LQVAEPEKIRIEVDNLGPDEVLKFLTSQRMILIKTERLHKQREKIGDKELRARSQELAVEQRRFRESFKEFTDIGGGHDHQGAEEETEEQPEGHNAALPEVPAGASESVRAMITAIRAMWRAETELQLANTQTAIVYEKEALTHLKNAQAGARHVTSFAPRSKPVDLKRRYQGRLDEIRNRIERTGHISEEQPLIKLTPILKGLYQAARSLAGTGDVKSAAQRIDKIAEDLLRVEGIAISSLVEPATKLKLITRHIDEMAKNEGQQESDLSNARQKVIKLVADVCGQIASLMTDDAGLATAAAPLNLSPSAGSKGAAYFKLLSRPE